MKVLIADDHVLYREGLAAFLTNMDSKIILSQTEDYAQTIATIKNDENFDLVIVDLDMPDMNWEEGLKKIMALLSEKNKMFIVSAMEDIKVVKKCLEMGASGYISKRANPKILESALKIVFDGGIYLPAEILHKHFVTCQRGVHKEKNRILTDRQTQVLRLAADGLSNKQIAYTMGVTESTVKLHINSLLKAFDATNRTQAVMFAQKQGLI